MSIQYHMLIQFKVEKFLIKRLLSQHIGLTIFEGSIHVGMGIHYIITHERLEAWYRELAGDTKDLHFNTAYRYAFL